ncbi:MAG: hypothetical protein KME35_03825 [Aphanocapsa sp. GSE-SYN-MK-11-07L]|jgi:hypothetical protein|nr:hypothetical protein [Aphanocapsa sp. GSE-SYN-MK-11-07L]
MLPKTANYSSTRPRSPRPQPERLPVPGRSPALLLQPGHIANVPLGEDALLVKKGRSSAPSIQPYPGTKSPSGAVERLCFWLSFVSEVKELRYGDKESQWRLPKPFDSLPPETLKVVLSKTIPPIIAEKPALRMPKANHYVVDGSKLMGAGKSILLGALLDCTDSGSGKEILARSPVFDYPLLAIVR